MFTPENSKHFKKYINEKNGMEFYILTTHVAPIQQGFYFVNSCFSDDGRFLYFYCAFPPANGRSAGMIDFLTDEISIVPNTDNTSSWYVDPRDGTLWFTGAQGIFRYRPLQDSAPILVFPWPQYIQNYKIYSRNSHLTLSSDYNEIQIDVRTEQGSILGTFNLLTGTFTEWYRSEFGTSICHSQFSPTNADLMLCAQDNFFNPITKCSTPVSLTEDGIYPRLRLLHRDGTCEIRPPFCNYATHEWWAPKGDAIYYVNNNACYDKIPGDGGTKRHHLIVRDRLDVYAPEVIADLPIEDGVGCWHAHCSSDEKYYVADGSYPSHDLIWWRGCPSVVRFWNNTTKKVTDICTLNPSLDAWTPEKQCPYHIDPHPRFVLNDEYISFTTTVLGCVDVALAPVGQLIDATK